jgi:hypothetical protein
LAALAVKLKAQASDASTRLKGSVILFRPDTVLGWHRALVRMKWTFKQAKKRGGRLRTDVEIEAFVVQMARDNSR